jgi:HPt (histidine-containing phosphotransfer) domain-containing protein
MSARFDLKRIAELQEVMGTELSGIVEALMQSMSTSIEGLEAALADGELEEATRAAHLCRNDALMVGARELQLALAEVESATRGAQLEEARAAFERLEALWLPTREELARVAGGGEP